MRYDPKKIPANVVELYTSGWADFMRLKISKYNLNDVNNSVEDIMQDMMLQMISNNYIENYDKNGRPFEVYLSVFIFNFMSKRYKKEHASKNGQKLILAKSLNENLSETGDTYDPSVEYLEYLEDPQSRFDNYTVLIESIKSDIKDFKAKSSVEFEGKIYDRDPITVFNLLLEGNTVAEIANIFQTSKQFIYLLLKKIRNCDALTEY